MSKINSRSKKQFKKGGMKNNLPLPLLLVLGGILLVGGALFALNQSNRQAAPKIPIEASGSPILKVDRDKVDLGDVPLNKTVTVSFLLSNAGDKPLSFSKPPYVEVVEGC